MVAFLEPEDSFNLFEELFNLLNHEHFLSLLAEALREGGLKLEQLYL